jgi:2-oxoisovalerate dehydrogenase E1 component beta subunit
MSKLTFARAINAGLRKSLENDPKVVLMGEDIGALGGVFRVTDGLQKDFGKHRVVDTPLAESAIIGTAVGLAYRGYRPVCEIQFDGFIYPAFDQIVSQVAKMHYRTQGRVKMPITIRVPFGGGIGSPEHHSESPEAYFTHTSGLRVISVSNPQDAYTMIQQAIASDDPVLYFEPKRRYHDKGEVDETAELSTALSMEKARVVTPGSDVTLVTYGPLVKTANDAAMAAADEGVSVEVIDLRSLAPSARPAGSSSRMRLRSPAGSAPKSPPASRSVASTTLKRRRSGSPGSTSRTRTQSSRCTTCRTWTGSLTVWTAHSAAATP